MTRHRFDAFSAIAGLLCLGLAAAVGIRTGPIGMAELQLIGPVAVLLLGIALLVSGGRDTAAPVDPGTPVGGRAPVEGPAAATSQAERDQGPADGETRNGGDGHGSHG